MNLKAEISSHGISGAGKTISESDESFQLLIAAHPHAHHLAFRVTGNEALAEEAVQEAYIRVVATLGEKELPLTDVAPWFFGIVLNVAKEKTRAEVRRKRREERVAKNGNAQDETEANRDMLRLDMQHALQQLDARCRLPLVMHYEMGLSYAEVARLLQTQERTVRKRVEKGIVNLRRILGAAGYTGSAAILIEHLRNQPLVTPTASATQCLNFALSKIQGGWKAQSLRMGLTVKKYLWAAGLLSAVTAVFAGIIIYGNPETLEPNHGAQALPAASLDAPKPFHFHWTFENGLPPELHVVDAPWHILAEEKGRKAALASHADEFLALRLPPETAQGDFQLTIKGFFPFPKEGRKWQIGGYSFNEKNEKSDSEALLDIEKPIYFNVPTSKAPDIVVRQYYKENFVMTYRNGVFVGVIRNQENCLHHVVALKNMAVEEIEMQPLKADGLPQEIGDVEKFFAKLGGQKGVRRFVNDNEKLPAATPSSMFVRWSFADGPAEALKVVAGEWKWWAGKNDAPGFMASAPDASTAVLLPVKVVKEPCVVSIALVAPSAAADYRFGAYWLARGGKFGFAAHQLWKKTKTNLGGKTQIQYQIGFYGRYALAFMDDKPVVFMEYDAETPRDRIYLSLKNFGVREITLRAMMPEDEKFFEPQRLETLKNTMEKQPREN